MSYDVEAYFVTCPQTVPNAVRGPDWQIVITGPLKIEKEDLYPEILEAVRNCGWLTQLNLEGVRSREALAALEALCGELIQKENAVLVDQQRGVIETRRSRKLLPSQPQEGRKEPPLTMSFFFEDGIRFESERFQTLYDLVEKYIPDALPRRYGPYEPLQYKLDERGKEHFIRSWQEDPELLWKGTAPFGHVYLSIRNDQREFPNGLPPQGPFVERYRCSCITFEATRKLLVNRKASDGLPIFFREATVLVGAFYAEVRLGYCPVQSWWWRGMPKGKTLAIALGPPYVDLWTAFRQKATRLEDEHYVCDLLTGRGHPPEPPQMLSEPDTDSDTSGAPAIYAEVFPFTPP